MTLRYGTVSFLSDYGTQDEFVGVVKSVIRSISPEVTVVDVTHGIEPFDVRGGGLALARSAQYLVPGVVVAVVDPGVGTERRGVAVEVGDGSAVLVGPDNGLLAPAVAMVGGATRAVTLDRPQYHLPAPGPTFDGRDVFAPVAAHLCNGVLLEDVGTQIDPASLVPGMLPLSRVEGGVLVAEVLWVDRYGNCQLNVDPDDLEGFDDLVEVRYGERRRTARRARSFAELGSGQVGLLVDSYGMLALTSGRGSAAEDLGLAAGDEVRLAEAEGEGPTTTTRVDLGRRGPGR